MLPRHRTLSIFLSALMLLLFSAPLLAQDEPYRNPNLSVEERVEDLLARMTVEEKIGQMTLVEKNSLAPQDVTAYFIGGVLSGGGGYPFPNTPEAWAEMVSGFQEAALATRLGIPMIYGVDAVHGHNNVRGAVIFPHNIGLGAARDPELVEEIGRITAQEMIATGIYWNYAPVVAVPQDIRWGRTYEGFSENTELVTELGTAYLRGLQGQSLSDPGAVLGTPKHYVGDGGAVWGTSPIGPLNIDRGVTDVDEETLRSVHLPPYQAAVEAGAQSIMVSFSSWGGMNMHAQEYLISEVLKGEMGFDGFVVSDWAGINLISGDYYEAVVLAVNAGVDMNMVPQEYHPFLEVMTAALENGDIPMERVNDAVRRILRVKFEMGLFEHPFGDEALLDEVGSDEHRAVAREAVSQSLVLLKNEDDTLPLAIQTPTIFLGGAAANDIGIQSGGWTIEWQGQPGAITPGTTILEALAEGVSTETTIYYDPTGRFENVADANGDPVVADVAIAVVGEMPYAEWFGDNARLALSNADLRMIETMRERNDKLVVILLSGRPVVITEPLLQADAFVAAWLPGTEGQGIADVLLGHQPFSGRLPYTWLRSIDQLPFDFASLPAEGCDAPLFPFGYGLTYEDAESEWLDLAAECAAH